MGALAAGVALLFMQMHHAVHKVVHHVRLNVRPPACNYHSCSASAACVGVAGVILQWSRLHGSLVGVVPWRAWPLGVHSLYGRPTTPKLTSAGRIRAQEHKTPVACGTLGALLIGCLAIVLPPVAFWGELEINTLADPTRPLPHLWPQVRAVFLLHYYMLPHLWPQARAVHVCPLQALCPQMLRVKQAFWDPHPIACNKAHCCVEGSQCSFPSG